MKVAAKLFTYFLADNGKLLKVGNASKEMHVDSLEIAQEEAREWVRRNRMSNPEHSNMRYRVELLINEQLVWKHDETEGDPLLEPTSKTSPSCPT